MKVKILILACSVLTGLLLAVENLSVVWAAWQDDEAGYWTDTFPDETGITTTISTTVDTMSGRVVLDAMRIYVQTDWSGGPGLSVTTETTDRYLSSEGVDETNTGALLLGQTMRADSALPDLNGDGYPDLVISNFYEGVFGSGSYNTDSYIYYGSADGYSITNRTGLSTSSAIGNAVADLNNDGYLDIVFAQNSISGSPIYWGSAAGYSAANRTMLLVDNVSGCSVADLNEDGYLDLVLAATYNRTPSFLTASYIYWGSVDGFSGTNRFALPTIGAMSSTVADLNQDGYLDIVFANYRNNGSSNSASTWEIPSYIYWGSADDYSTSARTELPTVGATESSVADLNGDGHLDIVFSNRHTANGTAVVYAVDSYIYWGSDTGYSTGNRTGLPTLGALGNSVADLDNDGDWDIIFSNHQSAESTHAIDSYIYWGSMAGYSTDGRTELPTVGAGSATVGDLDSDGYLDIIFANRRDGAQHDVDSYIYWGSATGYSTSDRSALPTHGALGSSAIGSPIICANTSFGNIYAQAIEGDVTLQGSMRTPRIYPSTGVLNSAAYGDGSTHTWKRAVWHAHIPSGTNLLVEAAISDDGSAWSDWQSLGSGSVDGANVAALSLAPSRYLRYRITLQGSADHRRTPELLDLSFWGDYAPSGSVESATITPARLLQWDEVAWSRLVGTGQAVTIQILDIDGALLSDDVLPGNSSGFATSPVDLSGIDPAANSGLRLRATLTRIEEMATPELQEWTLSWGVQPTAVDLVRFEANPQGDIIDLTWETATEYNTLGFYLYRADVADGLLIRLNENLILSKSAGTPTGATYAYTDKSVATGVTYDYWLEEVDNRGGVARNGPVSARIEESSMYSVFLPLVGR